ncbi:MAG: helix-turn-helix transcriptional regulator [Ruminococcaceae bacterium]|nr:helix-turn-helix transcriptional regulator [Oscillospiraceae bacterium]
MIYPFGENKTSKHSRYLSEIVKAKTYLETNYGTKITLPTVAAEVNLSPNFFRIVFKELVGRSPHEYLLEIRIRKAEAYLENTDFPINQIADLCGFETQSYMNYVFSKYCGVSPYKYRSMHHK